MVVDQSCSYDNKLGYMLETPSIRRYSHQVILSASEESHDEVKIRSVRTISRKDPTLLGILRDYTPGIRKT